MAEENMGKSSSSSDHKAVNLGNDVKGYSTISVLAKIFLAVIMKCWAMCTTVLLILLLLFWFYGGWATFALLVISVIGENNYYNNLHAHATSSYAPRGYEIARVNDFDMPDHHSHLP